jgi:hypothetical protein
MRKRKTPPDDESGRGHRVGVASHDAQAASLEPSHLAGKEQAPPLIVLWIVPGRPGATVPPKAAASARYPLRWGRFFVWRTNEGSPALWRLKDQ